MQVFNWCRAYNLLLCWLQASGCTFNTLGLERVFCVCFGTKTSFSQCIKCLGLLSTQEVVFDVPGKENQASDRQLVFGSVFCLVFTVSCSGFSLSLGLRPRRPQNFSMSPRRCECATIGRMSRHLWGGVSWRARCKLKC